MMMMAVVSTDKDMLNVVASLVKNISGWKNVACRNELYHNKVLASVIYVNGVLLELV